MAGDESKWGCLLPFLTDDPQFAHGVEVGILYEMTKHYDEIEGTFLLANQEQITLMANRLGWAVTDMRVEGDDFRLSMRRKGG